MTYRVISSHPIDAGYQVYLEDDDSHKAGHTSYHITAEAAESEALAIWNPS